MNYTIKKKTSNLLLSQVPCVSLYAITTASGFRSGSQRYNWKIIKNLQNSIVQNHIRHHLGNNCKIALAFLYFELEATVDWPRSPQSFRTPLSAVPRQTIECNEAEVIFRWWRGKHNHIKRQRDCAFGVCFIAKYTQSTQLEYSVEAETCLCAQS